MYTIKIKDTEYKVDLDKKNSSNVKVNNKNFELDVIEIKDNTFNIISENKSYNVELVSFNKEEKKLDIKINGDVFTTEIQEDLDLLLKELGMDSALTTKVNEIKAPMPGLVFDIIGKVGQEVKIGDTILILEAMKMENNIKSPTDGIIREIKCEKGKSVEKNDILVLFE